MRNPSSLKQEFLKKWTMGLQATCSKAENMSIMERKKAIKLSADVAMASARNGSTCWSRSIIANASTNHSNKALINCITGGDEDSYSYNRPLNKACHHPGSSSVTTTTTTTYSYYCNNIISRSKKILRRRRRSCHDIRRRKSSSSVQAASCIAKKLVQKRRELLKSLVPGGESMDHCSLIAETLDYIISLRAQVDVMRRLANASSSMLLSSK